jgi:hypothetical protein
MEIPDLSLIDTRGLTFTKGTLWEIERRDSGPQFGGWRGKAFTDLDSVFEPLVSNSHHPDGEF